MMGGPESVPVDETFALTDETTRYLVVTSAAFGLVNCFYGYRIFKIVLAATGFVVGAMVAWAVLEASGIWLVVGGALGGAVALALTLWLFRWAVFLFGAGVGAAVAFTVLAALETDESPWLIPIVGLVGGVLARFLERPLLIVVTALGGAANAILGTLYFFGMAEPVLGSLGSGDASGKGDGAKGSPLVALTAIAILGLVGVAVQFMVTRASREADADADEADESDGKPGGVRV